MDDNIRTLAGTLPKRPHPLPLFAPIVLDFFYELEQSIKKDPVLMADPAFAALAFWMRRKHIESFQNTVLSPQSRMGRGLIFHVTPTNIPVMFAYSLIISLLAGNSNIVRVSPRVAETVAPLCNLIKEIWDQPKFQILKENNALITYAHDKSITDHLTDRCDGRIIWGGNDSIREIRKSPLPPQAVELVFADRYSVALFDAQKLEQCSEDELNGLAHRFYNDTYDMDQNACSSPKVIFWLSPAKKDISDTQKCWWTAVANTAVKYDLAPIKVSHKYTQLWTFAMTQPEIKQIEQYNNNLLYVYSLSSLPKNMSTLSGTLGQFFQYTISDISEFVPLMDKKIQTISTFGIDINELRKNMISSGILGGDRIVSVGQSMEMDILWDGVNMVESLSRIIS